MEDSEERNKMLKAMRMEAAAAAAAAAVAVAQDDGSEGSETSMNTCNLSNPLAEASTHHQESCEPPRFDYYTDPMSAYSSFKRNKTSKQEYISSPSYQMMPPPAPEFPPSVPVPGSLGSDYQAHANRGGFEEAHCGGGNLHTEPRGMSPSHRGSPIPWNNNFRSPPPPFNHFGPPQWVPRPFPLSQGNPNMGNNRFGGRGGTYNNTAPHFPHYGPRQTSNWVGNTYPNAARGRSRGRGTNTSFRRGGGRRPMEQGAERFYSSSMAEDPWKYLKPVLWKSCSGASSSNSTGQARRPNSNSPKETYDSRSFLQT